MDYVKIGKLEESDFDAMIDRAGGQRISADHSREERPNADYALGEAVIELKVIEEEGLEKQDRQQKVADIFRTQQPDRPVVILRPELLDQAGQRAYYGAMAGPIKGQVKKAARQLEETANRLGGQPTRVLLLINNGYAALSQDEFKEIAVTRACNDTKNIDCVVVGGLYYYSDTFDMYFFPLLDIIPINADRPFSSFEALRQQWLKFGTQFMTEFVQGDNERNRTRLPVVEMRYDLDDVTYIKPAPLMGKPSELWPNGRPRKNSTDINACPAIARTFPGLDESNWRQFKANLLDSEEFFRDTFAAWLAFQREEDDRHGVTTKPFVPTPVDFDGFARWQHESGAPSNVQALNHYANEVFDKTVRRLIALARNRAESRIIVPEYIYLVTEEIGQDKANDLSSIAHVREGAGGSRGKDLLKNGRLFFEHALALACAYAVKHGVGIVLYDKDQTNAWI